MRWWHPLDERNGVLKATVRSKPHLYLCFQSSTGDGLASQPASRGGGAEGRGEGNWSLLGQWALPLLLRHTKQPTWDEGARSLVTKKALAGLVLLSAPLPLPGPGQRPPSALAAAGGAAGFLVALEMAQFCDFLPVHMNINVRLG